MALFSSLDSWHIVGAALGLLLAWTTAPRKPALVPTARLPPAYTALLPPAALVLGGGTGTGTGTGTAATSKSLSLARGLPADLASALKSSSAGVATPAAAAAAASDTYLRTLDPETGQALAARAVAALNAAGGGLVLIVAETAVQMTPSLDTRVVLIAHDPKTSVSVKLVAIFLPDGALKGVQPYSLVPDRLDALPGPSDTQAFAPFLPVVDSTGPC